MNHISMKYVSQSSPRQKNKSLINRLNRIFYTMEVRNRSWLKVP